jgi:hypothetical protein
MLLYSNEKAKTAKTRIKYDVVIQDTPTIIPSDIHLL